MAWELLWSLYLIYQLEDPNMARTIEEFRQEIHEQFMRSIPPEKWQKGLAELPPEERLRGLSPEERLRGLSPEELQRLEAYLKTLH